MYIENPKLKDSGLIGCIPQTGTCPNNCSHCFFQSGRSYLEPLSEKLPNIPSVLEALGKIVRMNDGNDSNVHRDLVIEASKQYQNVFFNTAIPRDIDKFPGPVVLTLNPGNSTDNSVVLLDPVPKNLMFVRIRTTTWNLDLVSRAFCHYCGLRSDEEKIPVVLTFMAYFAGDEYPKEIPENHRINYEFRKRTLNNYWAIKPDAWREVMREYQDNPYVYSCGNEGAKGGACCRRCGNCIREYYATLERMKK